MAKKQANKQEYIYVPRFKDTKDYYVFGGRNVNNIVAARQMFYTDVNGKKKSYAELRPLEIYADFNDLIGKEIYSIDDAFICYEPGKNYSKVFDKRRMTQANWWGLQNETNFLDPKLIQFEDCVTMYGVPKKSNEEKSQVEAKAFDMIQNILNEEEPYTQNRFLNMSNDGRSDLASFKTGVVFKIQPWVFDLLVMNGRYDFKTWYFINSECEGTRYGKGLKWLNAYLQDVKTKRNAYMKSQYFHQL